MRRFEFTASTLVLMLIAPSLTQASELWALRDGTIEFRPDWPALEQAGLDMSAIQRGNEDGQLKANLSRTSSVDVLVRDDGANDITIHAMALNDGIMIRGRSGQVVVLHVQTGAADGSAASGGGGDVPSFELTGLRSAINRGGATMIMPAESVRISPALADALGDRTLAGLSIGRAIIRGSAEWQAGLRPDVEVLDSPPAGDESEAASAPSGADVTFCEFYGLQQQGRVGSIAAFAGATTSWNVGNEDAIWYELPDPRHPFIVQNVYRLKSDRFEHIGQGWVKHGFFALDSEQCGTDCTYEPGSGHGAGDWLGVGCTDTYSAGLNGLQSGLGPRQEINPWTGAFTWAGSHLAMGGGSHTAISHRVQIHDDDLVVSLNPAAFYFAEGYYVVNDDVNHMNNAAWKPITFTGGGSGGGTWSVGMTGTSTRPTTGFALDAWSGSRKTVLAQEIPPIKFQSPDGRCILGAKSTDLGGGNHHYEYALLNIDMNRKVNSFSVPIMPGTVVTNIDFHAVRSHDETYNNDPWVVTGGGPTDDHITWSTTNNPLRWGTLYNFRFDAVAPPMDATITIGLHEPGTPSSLTGVTTGPSLLDPTCPALAPQLADAAQPRSRYLTVEPQLPGQMTALRVRLAALYHPLASSAVAGGPDFSAFEGEYRWVGPPQTHFEGMSGGPTFVAAELQCEPYFHDWGSVGDVSIFGDSIVPASIYEVQALHQNCESEIGNESRYSSLMAVPTGEWGDVVGNFGSGQPDFQDIAAVVSKFQGTGGAPSKARAQLQPNVPSPSVIVNFADVSAAVSAFAGSPYPFAGPSACP